MAQNDFILKITAFLDKVRSKKQIKSDIKTFNIKFPFTGTLDKPKTIKQIKNDIKALRDIFFVNLTGKLNKTKTKAQLKQDTASLTGTVSLTGKVNQKSINASVQQATKQAQAVANKNKIKLDASFNIKKSKLLADIQYFAQQNSKMMKDANMASKYNTLLDNAKLATSNKEIRNLRMQLSAMRSELRANNLAGLTLGDTLKKTFKRAMELFSGTGFVMLLSQQLRQAWRESLNLDQAFTNLVKVQSALTRGDYPEYLEQCTRKAKELATTQQALIEGATEFSKSGYDLTTSNKLSEKSTILSNVGEMSASDSAKAIISGVQAYDVVDGYTDVVDKADALISKYNEIGNSASITTAEIAQGVQAVGSVFKDANTSVDEFIALLAAGNRQFQDADSLALGLRTAALRIRGCTTELQLMNEETDGVYTSASKLQEKIADLTNIDGKGGVQILEADGETFRSIYDIFVDISKVYKDMSDVDQSALLELISGKHRASAISATISNMAEAQEIYQRSLESAGSAQEEYDKYLESSIASLNNFKANMIETYQAVFNGETTKAILDTGSSVLELLNSLGLIESTLKGFIAIGAVKALTTLSTAFKASALQASNFGKALQFSNSIPNGNLSQRFTMLKNIAIASKSLNEAQLKLVLSNKALSNEDRIRILRLMGLEKSIAKAKLEEMGLTQATNAQSTAQKAATINTFSFSAAVKGLGNSLRLAFISNPVGIAIMTLSTIIGAVSAKVSEYKENIRETRQANMDAATSAKEEADSLNELYIQYSKLSSITDKTSQQEDDFKQVVQDITKALGNKADALENVTIGTDEYAKSLREATKAELESQYATAKVGAKAAEEALKDKTYSGWDGSQITIAKNEQMTAIEEHVAALEAVQDILAKYEDMSSNGIEWEPVGWDEDRNDMNAVLEYYYDLIEARDRLATDENADFLMSSDIYKNINTTINSLSESVKNYTEQQYQALLLQYEWQNGIPRTEEEFKAMEASILSASGAGEEFQKILKDFLINDFSSFFPEEEIAKTEQSSKKLFDQITSSIKQISTQLEPQFSKLKDAYQSIFTVEDGKQIFSLDDVDASMLEDLRKSFAEIEEEIGVTFDANQLENFFAVLTNGNSTAEEVQNAFNGLATSYLFSTDVLNSLNDTTVDAIAKQLESLGVTNATALATEVLATKQEYLAQTGQDLSDATAENINALIEEKAEITEEGIVLDTTTQKIIAYWMQKQAANGQLSTVGDIQQLSALCDALGVSTKALRNYIYFKKLASMTDVYKADSISIFDENAEKYMEQAQKDIQSIYAGFGGANVDYSPIDSKKASKSSKDTTESINWITRAIENLESEISRLDKVIDSSFTSFSEKNEAIAEQIGLVNKEIELQQKAYEAYMAKADSINLSDKYKELVQNGALNIEDIKDEKLQKAIKSYQDYYDKAKETQDKINDLYEQSSQLHVDNYNLEAEELGKYRDKHLIDMAKYYQSMMDLQDKYYNSEALKLKELADKMEVEYGRMSSINLTRPSVDASAIQEAGYTTELQSSSVYAQSFGNEEKQVVVTPILPDGTILSPEALAEYANKLLNGEKIDANIELAMFEGKDAVKQTVEYINGLESMQSKYQELKSTLSESPYGDFTEEQIKAIEELSEELNNVMSQLSGELGDIKSAYDSLIEIRDTYNEYGKISVDQYQSLCDMGFQYLALLSDESGALSLDEEAFQRLADAKIQEMQVTMALQALDLINNIKTEEDAIRQLSASYQDLSNNALSAAENMLYAAKQKLADEYGTDSLQVKAAENIIKGYQNSKALSAVVSVKNPDEKEKEKDTEIRDWAEKILDNIEKGLEKANDVIEKISDKTDKLINAIDKFFTWQKKNSMINRAIKSSDKEIAENQNQIARFTDAIKRVKSVANLYTEKLNSISIPDEYKDKIKNGALNIEEIADEDLRNAIKDYEEWYEKLEDCKDKMEEYNNSIQDCRDSISDLYDQQRDLIRQKLDNVLDYYSDMDSYLSSITSKVESLISLNDQMGKRSSLTELVEQFANLNKQIESVTAKGETVEVVKKQIASGTAESVQKAVADDNAKEAERIQNEIDNLAVTESGTYDKLLSNIAKMEAQIDKYIEKGWDVTKSKQFDSLIAKLQNYYDLQAELDNWATSNTIVNYQKVYTAYQKLQNKLDSGKDLSKSEWKKYTQYQDQIEALRAQGRSAISELYNELANVNGTAETQSEADKIKGKIEDIQKNLENSAIYQNLVKNIENTQNKIAELDAIGYDNLTKTQKKTYDKLTATLEDYYAQKESLDQGATNANIAQYNKIYLAWKKLQDKLDAGKNLSPSDWKKYDSYTKQLENWVNDKATQYEELNSQLQDALNPPDKQGVIKKEYEESSKQMYDSYQNQIDAINDEVKNTQAYKNLLANIQKLEQTKDTKGLSKAEEDKLKKYQAELEALKKGGTATNVTEYMKTWEAWYKLQQKLDSGKQLKPNEAVQYDKYKAQLEAWNNEKQTQINDLLSQMEDDLEALNKTYTENLAEAEDEINKYYENLYSLAKQIAEFNISKLDEQLNRIQSMVSYYKNLVGLYETFSGDKLSRLLVDLDEDTALSKLEIYQRQLTSLNEEYDTTKNKIKEYQQLLEALKDTNDFASSMDLFNTILNDETVSQATKDNLQQVIDLLNERALSADNWGEYADQWENEWQQALAETKQSLIEVAGSIQEVNDAIREISLESLTDAITQLGYLKDTLSSITGLINDDWIFDEDGELTEYGNAKVSLLVEQMQTARNEADKYAQQIDAIMSMHDTYSSENAYQTALQEAKSNYLSSLNELKGFEDSVVSIMTQSNESIINSLKDVISARIKALKAQKDLYEYNKTITNSQKEIDNIKAQIDALENLTGATDAATKAKLAQLKADLEEKETALQETKDDHTYNLQITALEDFMDTLDQTMSDATDAVNKSFATYKEAIDSALKVYEENKDYLGEWSNTIMRNTLGLANTDGANTIDVDVQQSGSGESQSSVPFIEVVNGDTVSAIESSTGTLHGDLIDIKTAIEQGIIVKVDSPLTAINPEMMNFVRNYVPPMINAVVNTLPQIAERNTQPVVINNHYDSLINVEGNVDKDIAKLLPKQLEEAYQYTTKKLYRENMKLK